MPACTTTPETDHFSAIEWKKILVEFEKPSAIRACWQLANTILPYICLWGAMLWLIGISYWLALPAAALAAAFMVRTFIIFHDCGHGSFFKSRKINDLTGFITGVLTFTPYYHWRWEHSLHHATSGNLAQRGTGDIWTMTVKEYLTASRWTQFKYRVARNPVVLFIIAPTILFMFWQRIPNPKAGRKERLSVWWTNLALAGIVAGISYAVGFATFMLLLTTVMVIAGAAGVWLFYVQHQYDETYWERPEKWDYVAAALQGSSYYKLPRILQWFSGNIGFHHLHHLNTRIPNYRLEKGHKSHPRLSSVKPLTLFPSFRMMTLALWDEDSRRLISFRQLRNTPAF